MKPNYSMGWLAVPAVAGLCVLAACQAKTQTEAPAATAAPAVPAAGRSPVADAIAKHLEYGGDFFLVFDIKSDLTDLSGRLAKTLDAVAHQPGGGLLPPTLDYGAELRRSGLFGIAGGGLSSWRMPNDVLYHNSGFLYVPDGRQGLLKVFGGPPAAFVSPTLAPADADLAYESTMDLKSLEEVILDYVKDVGGAVALQQAKDALGQPVAPGAKVTWQQVVDHLNSRVTIIGRLDPKKTIEVGPGISIPRVDLLIALDGFSDLLAPFEPMLQGLAKFEDKNGMRVATLDLPLPPEMSDYSIQLTSDPASKRLYLSTSEAFANVTIGAQGARLAGSDDFKTATAGLPTMGNALIYASKNGVTTGLKAYQQAIAASGPSGNITLALVAVDKFMALPHGIASVQVNQTDGIFTQSVWPSSGKDLIMMVPAMAVGFAASAAIPAYTQLLGGPPGMGGGPGAMGSPALRPTGDLAVRNNLRQLATAGSQYMLEKGVTQAAYSDLVGTGTDNYIRSISPVEGEDYSNFMLSQTATQITVRTAAGKVIPYDL